MYKLVTEIGEVRKHLSGPPAADGLRLIAFDFETAPDDAYRDEEHTALDPHKAHIIGVSFSAAEGESVYVPMAHRIGANADHAEMLTLLAGFANDPSVIKVAHNLAFESMFLYKHGIVLQQPCYDTIAAAQMTLKGNTAFRSLAESGLKTLVPTLLGDELPTFSEVKFETI